MEGLKGKFNISKGNPTFPGANYVNGGINFSINAPNAFECKINIYDKHGKLYDCIKLDKSSKTGNIFSVFVDKFDVELYCYTYEIMGNVFVDPYAKRICGREIWGKPINKKKTDIIRALVYKDDFDWKDDRRPHIPYEDAIFYKAHLRGFTKHKSSKVDCKGTFKGFAQKADYLRELGITSVILMPVYEFDEIIYDKYLFGPEEVTFIEYDKFLQEQQQQEDPVVKHYERLKSSKGIIPYKINYWGYGMDNCYYFAPKTSYAYEPENAVNEFKMLVSRLHSLGIECIMEFNFKEGVDKQFVYECFRFWTLEYHIDGFKFNSNSINGEFIAADPILGDVKLICEGWNENAIYGSAAPVMRNLAMMNDDYMINIRKFLKGDEEQAGDFAYKFRRNPDRVGIINYLTNSNGFTLNDLFSYDVKHNEANGELGNDGTDYNYSWNCGVEGKTRKHKVLQLRRKQFRNAFTLLLLSQGSPMILAGDEFLNSQSGNNNAYCQDNETTWLNWNMTGLAKENLEFVKNIISIRKNHRIFHTRKEMRIMDYVSVGCPDMSYHGTKAWYPEFSMYSRTLGILLYGKYAGARPDSSFYIAINMHWEDHKFDLPKLPDNELWECIVDCGAGGTAEQENITDIEDCNYDVKARDVVVFMSKDNPDKGKINKKRNKD